MERIAFLIDNITIYWSAIILTLAAAGAVCLFLALYLGKTGKTAAAAVCVPLAIVLSLLFGRAAHWYCRPDAYDSLMAAMDLRTPGGFALMGVFGGCLLAAILVRLLRLTNNMPELLDCMCLAGGAGIAVGRLWAFFNASDRGMMLPSTLPFPWVCPGVNPVSGMTEYRLATFLLQAIAAGGITLSLLVFYLAGQRKKLKDGDTCLLFLLFYGASQVLLDSTRYDSLYFRSNGFVSVVQVLGALALAVGAVVFSLRLVRAGGWKKWYLMLWTGLAACFGLAGYMEYYVQRHGGQAVFAYCMMGAALLDILMLTVMIRCLAVSAERKHASALFGSRTSQGGN
ncbi:MAG: prolipoprotein diacylglyceryl transferase [Oscillospiraceae bacterium]|nr:prolipoprotein diacylglyceryl transferase [Oscillospiraceae bacterium]